MTEQKKTFVAFLLLLAVITAAIVGAVLFNLPKHYRLNKYGIETWGTIISKEKENHQYMRVEYEVDNRKFDSGGHAEDVDKNFDSVQLKEEVIVYYDPRDPQIAVLGNPAKNLKSSISGICFVSIIPILFFLSYRLKKFIWKPK